MNRSALRSVFVCLVLMVEFDASAEAPLATDLLQQHAKKNDEKKASAPTDVPLPTEKFKSYAAFPPSGQGLRVQLDHRRWVELIGLASYGKIAGEETKVFWTAEGNLIDPPDGFDPTLLVPDQKQGKKLKATREILLQIVGQKGFGVSLSTSGYGGYGHFRVPIDDEFEQFPLNSVLTEISDDHAYIEIKVSGDEWEAFSTTELSGVFLVRMDEDRHIHFVTDNASDFSWKLDVQRDGEKLMTVTPSRVGGAIRFSSEELKKSIPEDLHAQQIVSFHFDKEKPLPEIIQLKRSRYDVVRFDNLSVYPGPHSAVRVSLNGVPVDAANQPILTDKQVTDSLHFEEGLAPRLPEYIKLKGSVVDGKGQPVSNCWVGVFTKQQEFSKQRDPGSEFDNRMQFDAEGRTGPDGSFTLIAPKTHFVFEGGFWAVRSDGASGVVRMNAVWPSVQRGVKVTVAEESGSVQILDPQGSPIAGASVTLEAVKNSRGLTCRLPQKVQEQQTVTTDEAGQVTFRGWSSAAIRGLSVTTNEYGTQYLDDLLASSWVKHDAMLEITLHPTASLHGRVLGFDAKEHAGLKLQVQTETRGERPPMSGRAVAEVQQDGTFTIDHIAAGWVSMVTSLSPDSSWKMRIPSVAELAPGEERVLKDQLQLEPAVTVRQQIVKSDTGEGIPEIKLRVLWGRAAQKNGGWRQSITTQTDKNGWWEAKVLAGPINVRISSVPEGYEGTAQFDGRNGPRGVAATIPAAEQVVILPPEQYVPSREMSGRLQYADGSPAADWAIYGHPISWDDGGVGGVLTKKNGSFTCKYPLDYPPRLYNARNQEWMTNHNFEDWYLVPKVISTTPLVLEIPEVMTETR